ncbi:MAG: C-terminal binding protein [Candidatus Tectomicrobia bacterium]|nr:C-terminal binding protein [Candidatus Tectomicrobia bacterium]
MERKLTVVATQLGMENDISNNVEQEVFRAMGVEFIAGPLPSQETLFEALSRAHGVLAGGFRMTGEVMDQMPHCLIISGYGVGYDHIDVEAATARGICVTNVSDWCMDEVSDVAMMHILAAHRKLAKVHTLIKQGGWSRQAAHPSRRLKRSTLGVVGVGSIGRALVKKAAAFGFRILGYDPYVFRTIELELPIEMVDFDDLLKNSDYISIHMPLTSETRGMFGEEEFRKMKPTAYLINTARGAIVSNKALYKAISEGWIAGAGLDVLEKEPPDPDEPLLTLDQVTFTPHYGSYTEEAYHEAKVKATQNVATAIQGKVPKYLVNREVLSRPNCRLHEFRKSLID